MFELIGGERRRTPHGTTLPILFSTAIHVLALGAIVAISVVSATRQLPEPPDMMAFVAFPPPAPLPPPPPPPPRALTASPPRRVLSASRLTAPVEAPPRIEAETAIKYEVDSGVPGGVEGGVPGGVVGAIVSGLAVEELLPPPPPPPAPRAPIRVGGDVQPPALVRRLQPVYPDIAIRAQIEGVVILEAVVDREGHVEDVRVLRSNKMLERAAVEAVRQWQYSPLLLNGKPERFILTVTVSFRLPSGS